MSSTSATEEALHDIPPEYRDRAEELLSTPVESRDAIRQEVEAYVETVRQVSVMVQMLDVDSALGLANALLKMLSGEPGPPEHERLVQMAAHYLVREDDDEEVTGVLGFDDDIQVLNAVCRVVGREDLVMPLPHHRE